MSQRTNWKWYRLTFQVFCSGKAAGSGSRPHKGSACFLSFVLFWPLDLACPGLCFSLHLLLTEEGQLEPEGRAGAQASSLLFLMRNDGEGDCAQASTGQMGPLAPLVLLLSKRPDVAKFSVDSCDFLFQDAVVDFFLRKLRFPLSTSEVSSRSGKTLVLGGSMEGLRP